MSALVDEPLLGDAGLWQRWFALAGVRARVNPVATFNDAGLMLQAAEQNIGLALAREILVADALREGRLLRLSPVSMQEEQTDSYWLAFPPSMRDWPPLKALQKWLFDELGDSQRELQEGATETTPADRSRSRSRAASAAPRKRRASMRPRCSARASAGSIDVSG